MKNHTHLQYKQPSYYAIIFVIIFALTGGAMALLAIYATTVVMVPDSISAVNCSQNVSLELNNWLAGVANGSTIQFAPGGCYRIDQTLVLTNRSSLTIDGNGSTFKTNHPTGDSSTLESPSTAARTRAHWRLDGGNNITLTNMTVIGAHPNGGTSEGAYVVALEAQHGVDILGTQNALISQVDIYDVYGDFVYFGKKGTALSSGRVTGGRMERNGRQGITVTGGSSILIDGNYIGNTRWATFDFEPNGSGWSADGVTVNNNEIGSGRLLFVAAHGSGPVNNIAITNNRLTGRALNSSIAADASGRRQNWTFENNSSNSEHEISSGSTINFTGIDNIRVVNNTQPMRAGRNMALVTLQDSTGLVIRGNTLANAVESARLVGLSTVSENCGNRYSATGAFDKPTTCPSVADPPSPPPPAIDGSTPSDTPGTATGSVDNSLLTSQNMDSSNLVQTPPSGIRAVLSAPAKVFEQGMTIVASSDQPLIKRILTATLILTVITGCLLAVWMGVRFIVNVAYRRLAIAGAGSANTTVNFPANIVYPSQNTSSQTQSLDQKESSHKDQHHGE